MISTVEVTAIRLVREGGKAVVYITFRNGVEVKAIEELLDGEFHHSVHTGGLEELEKVAHLRLAIPPNLR